MLQLIRRHSPTILLCLTIAACLTGGSPSRTSESPVTLVVGVPQSRQSDPAFGINQMPVLLSQEGLTAINPDGRAVPRIARSWTESEDGLAWNFRLRDDVVFHDGTPVDADLVKQSLESALTDPTLVALRPGVLDISSIHPTAPLELTVRLRRRSTFLLGDLELAITKSSPKGPAGTGPFHTAFTSREEIVMEAHRRYHLGPPAIDRVILRSYPTLRAAWASFMRGEIDLISEVGQDAVAFAQSSSVRVFTSLRPYAYVIVLNSSRRQLQPPLVRRALNLAIDRSALLQKALNGHGRVAEDPVWPKHWAATHDAPRFAFNPPLAVSLLESSGLRRPSVARVASELPARLTFTCLVPQDFTTLERLALTVQKQLFEIGVNMRLSGVPADTFNVRVSAGDFDAAILELIGGPSLARVYQFWHSPGELKGRNVFGYNNPKADDALDAIRHAVDETSMREGIRQFQNAVVEDPPAIFLAWKERARALRRGFLAPTDPDHDVLQSLRLWRRSGEIVSR